MLQPLPVPHLDIREAAPPVAPAPPAPPAAGVAWAQLGAWATRTKAEEIVRRKRSSDAPPPMLVRRVVVRGRPWFRVIAGPLTFADASTLCRTYHGRGRPCWLREGLAPSGFSPRDAAAPPG